MVIMRIKPLYLFAVITILISLITWSMDIFSLVKPCIDCRVERTIIGLLGLILLLPRISQWIKLLAYVLGFFGANVASGQMFSVLIHYHITGELILASCALIIIIVQVFYIHSTGHS